MVLLQAVKRKNTFERNLITNKLCAKKLDFYRRTTDGIKCFCENLHERFWTMSVTVCRWFTRTCYFVRPVLNNDVRQPLKHDARNCWF